MKKSLCVLSIGLAATLGASLWVSKGSVCEARFQSARVAVADGYYAEALGPLRSFFADMDCQTGDMREALLLAAEARIHVPELQGRERRQHFAILNTVPEQERPLSVRVAMMQAALVTAQYQRVVDSYGALEPDLDTGETEHVPDLLRFEAMSTALAAHQALRNEGHVELLFERIQGLSGLPYRQAYLRRLYGRMDGQDPSAADRLMSAILSPEIPEARQLEPLQRAPRHGRLFVARLLAARGHADLVPVLYEDTRFLDEDEASVMVRALWQEGDMNRLAGLGERLDTSVTPEDRLYVCEALLRDRTEATCDRLFDSEDISRRYGARYAALWGALLTARPLGPDGYLAAIDALEKLKRFDAPSPLRSQLLAKLYQAVGETDLAAREAANARDLKAVPSPLSWETRPYLPEARARFLAGATFSGDDLKALKANSPSQGILWRQIEADALNAFQEDIPKARALRLYREILDRAPAGTDSYSLSLLKLSDSYAYFGDRAAVREALVSAVEAKPEVLPLAYATALALYQQHGEGFQARDLADVWATLAWKEAKQVPDATAPRPVADRLSLLLRFGIDRADQPLIAASCRRLQDLVGSIAACQ